MKTIKNRSKSNSGAARGGHHTVFERVKEVVGGISSTVNPKLCVCVCAYSAKHMDDIQTKTARKDTKAKCVRTW